jgi:tetratricopeptide (TPR) repeat protein
MGYVGCLFAWLHPIRHTRRRAQRALTPRPIRRVLRAKNQVLHPISSAERAVFRSVDRAITPKRKRKMQPQQPPSADVINSADLAETRARVWAIERQARLRIERARLTPGQIAQAKALPQSHAPVQPGGDELLRGFAAFDPKDLDLAEQRLRAVVDAATGIGMAHNNLGFVLLAKGQVEDALAAFRRAEDRDSDRLEVIEANMACCHYLLGYAADSSALFESCLSARSFKSPGILYGISGDRLFLVSVKSATAYTQLMALNAAWSASRAGNRDLAARRATTVAGAPLQDLADSLNKLRAELRTPGVG